MEKDTEFADGLGVNYEWLKKWAKRSDAPPGRAEHDAIERALAPLGVPVTWLYDGRGMAPWPDLWAYWTSEMRDVGTDELNAPPASVPRRSDSDRQGEQ